MGEAKQVLVLLLILLGLRTTKWEKRGKFSNGGKGFSLPDTSTCTQWKGGCCFGFLWASKETGKACSPHSVRKRSPSSSGINRYNSSCRPWKCACELWLPWKDLINGVASVVLTYIKSSQAFRILGCLGENDPSMGVPVVAQWVIGPILSLWGCRFDCRSHQVVEGPGIATSSGIGHRRSTDLALLWLWCRPQLQLQFDPWLGNLLQVSCETEKKKKKKKRLIYLLNNGAENQISMYVWLGLFVEN